MVPWRFLAGTVACVLFPQVKGPLIAAWGLALLLQREKNAIIEEETSGQLQPVTLEWQDIHCAIVDKNGKQVRALLDGVSGAALPGRLLAIMGPSGCGKSTLLNTLAGQVPLQKALLLTGHLLLNGQSKDDHPVRQAYVRQEDIFFSQLTVRETLQMAARLRLPAAMTAEETDRHVDALIQRLGLALCAESRVGDAKQRGLSGGEKKRLSIATELVATPSILLADEPTTGLDAFQAEKVMQTLRQLAQDGHTVICSIHQPRGSIYSLLDDLLLLVGGQVVYSGPAQEAVAYFQHLGYPCPTHSNPAELFSDLISVDFSSPAHEAQSRARVATLVNAWRAQHHPRPTPLLAPSPAQGPASRRGGALTQFRLLFLRAWRQTLRDRSTNRVRAAMNVCSALVFGSIFWRVGRGQSSIQDRMGLLQVAAINTAMASLMKTLNVFPRERVIVSRERSQGSYGTAPYFASKLLAELPVGALFPLLFASLVYPMAGLQASFSRFSSFLTLLTLESFAASALGLSVGSVAPTTEAALALGPSLMTVFIVFGGYYVNTDSAPRIFRWIPNVSLIRWAFQGLALNEFRGLRFEASKAGDAASGEQVLERLSFANSTIRRALSKEAQLVGFFYLTTFALLKNNAPKFVPLLAPPSTPPRVQGAVAGDGKVGAKEVEGTE